MNRNGGSGLTGPLAPELSVDRNSIRKLRDEPAVDALLIEAVPALLRGGSFELTMEWLSDLGEEFPVVADAVLDGLFDDGSACWTTANGARVPIAEVGCFSLDRELLQATRQPKPETGSRGPYDSLADYVTFKRIACWERVGKLAGIRREDDWSTARPSDMVLVGNRIRYRGRDRWGQITRHSALKELVDTLFVAGQLRRPPTEIASRVRQLDAVPPSLKSLEITSVLSDDLVLLSDDFSGSNPFFDDTVPLGHLLAAAQHTGRKFGEVAQRFQLLGFKISLPHDSALEKPEPWDLVLLSLRLDGKSPWVDRKVLTLAHHLLRHDRVPLSEILGLAFSIGRSPEMICAMLESVGVAVPDVSGIETTTDDAILLSTQLGGVGPWVQSGSESHLMVAHIFAAAIRLRRSVPNLAKRVRYFGIPVADPAGWNACPVTAPSLIILARNINLRAPWIDDRPVPAAHILRAASFTGLPPREIARTLVELDFPVGEVPDLELTHEEDHALGVLLDVPHPDPEPPEGRVPSRAAVLATVHHTGRDLNDIFLWMEKLGMSVGWDKTKITDGVVDLADVLAMSRDLDGEGPWLPDDYVPPGHVLATAIILGCGPIDIAERFRALGFHVPHSPDPTGSELDAVDLTLLSRFLNGYAPRLTSPSVPLAHILRAACVFGCDVAEIRSRYERLDFTVPDATPEITDTERAFLTVALHNADTANPASKRISTAQVLGVAEFARTDPATVASHLARTGLAVPPLEDLRAIRAGQISPRDALLLSAELDSRGPWLSDNPVPLAHIIASAGYLRWTPGRVAQRLTDLGCVAPPLTMNAQDAFIDGVDAALVEAFRTYRRGYLDHPVSRAETLAASYRFRWTPSKIAARLIELGFSVPSFEAPAI
jgi:hypothetical protein